MFQELDLINNLIHGNGVMNGKPASDSPQITSSSSFFGSVNTSSAASNNTGKEARTFGGAAQVVTNGTRMSCTPSSHSSADSVADVASRQASCSPTADAISNLLLGHQSTANSQLVGSQQHTAMTNGHAGGGQGGVLGNPGNNNLLDFSVSQLYGGHFADHLDVSNLFQGMSSHINGSSNNNAHLLQQNSSNLNNSLRGPVASNSAASVQQLNSHLSNVAASQAVPTFSQQTSAEALHNGLLSQMQSPEGVTAALAAAAGFGQQPTQQQQQQTEAQRLQQQHSGGVQSHPPAGAIRHRHRSSASDSMFKCNYCPKKYPSQAALQNHMDECRMIRVHECSQCGKRFKARGGLQQHNRIHINDRPYHCHYCPKRFTQKSHVDQHERIHTGLKPFSCQFCGRAFRQRSQQMGHEATHTNGHSNNGSVSAVGLALANQSLGLQHGMDRDSHRNSLSSDQTSCQNSPSNEMNSPGSSSLNNHQTHSSSQSHQIQQQQQQQQQFVQQQQQSSQAAAAAAAAASLQHAQQQMNMMAQMGQMAQGLGQDMKLQQNMLQNMLNGGGGAQLAADSLLALKHDPSYQLLFANGNRQLPTANKTTINDYL